MVQNDIAELLYYFIYTCLCRLQKYKIFRLGVKNSYGIINSIEHITVPFNDTRTLLNQRLRAPLPLITLADLSGNRGLLQRVQKVTSVVRFRSILFVSVFSLLSSWLQQLRSRRPRSFWLESRPLGEIVTAVTTSTNI